MSRMVRKQIYIEPEQEALLKRLTRLSGISEAELIRQAIEHQIRFSLLSLRDLEAWRREKAFITRLMKQGPVRGRRTWKREELYE